MQQHGLNYGKFAAITKLWSP